jgi:hypothetical protein
MSEFVERPNITCHAPFGHDWQDEESKFNPEGGGFYLSMRCTKCGTVFKQIINTNGTIHGGRQYRYAPGYKDESKWSRADWRLNYLLGLDRGARRKARR